MKAKKKKKSKIKPLISLLIVLILVVFFAYYIDKNIVFIKSTFNTTFSNLTQFFFIAVVLILFSFYFKTKAIQLVFKMNGLVRRIWDLYKINLAGMAVNVIIPTAGLSSMMIYAEDAQKKGESRATTVNSVLVTIIAEYTSISLFLIISLVYLYVTRNFIPHVLVPAIIFLAITMLAYLFAFFAGRESKRLEKFIKASVRLIEKPLEFILKKDIKVNSSVEKVYHHFKEVNKAIINDPKDWALTIFYSAMQHVLALSALYIIFISLGFEPTIRALLAGYSVGVMFIIVSPTPSGIGFVEGGMYLVFTTLGVPGPIATTATLIYRTLTFWLPLFFGFLIYQRRKIKEILEESDFLAS